MNYNKKYNILQSQIGGSDGQPVNNIHVLTLKAYAHYTNLQNNMSLYCDKDPDLFPPQNEEKIDVNM